MKYLRLIADSQIDPVEAVKAYHGDLQKLGIRPSRPLNDDLQTTVQSDSYSGSSTSIKSSPEKAVPGRGGIEPLPDFSKMTQEEKLRWNLDRIRRM